MRIVRLVLLLSVVSIVSAHAQEFFVLQVKGQVQVSRTKSMLKTNDRIKSDDKLTFGTPNDMVAVVGKSGRFLLKPTVSSRSSELTAIVKDMLLPSTGKLSTRSAKTFSNLVNFQTFFSNPIVLLKERTFTVDTTVFNLTSQSFFFVRYKYKDTEINKKLASTKTGFLLNRNELYRIDGQPVNEDAVTDITLHHMLAGKPRVISRIDLVTPPQAGLVREVDIIKSQSDQRLDFQSEVKSYIEEFYGLVDDEDLASWLKVL